MRVQSTPKPITRRPVAAAAAPQAIAAPRPVAPVKAASQASVVPKGITVDVAGHAGPDGNIGATGTVTLDRVFMERLVRHVTRKQGTFGERDIKFDPASGTYAGTVQLKVKGRPITLVGKVLPVVDGNMPGFKFQELGIKLGSFTLRFPGLTTLAAKLIAKEITAGGIESSPGKGGIVRLEPTSLLRDAEVLPGSLYLDRQRTQFDVKMAPTGDVTVKLTSDVPARQGPDTPLSDLAIAMDEAALLKLLKPALGNDYQVSKVTIGQGTITLDGLVEAKPLSDAANLVKGILAAIIAARGGRVGHVGTEKAMIGLKLQAQLQGTSILLTPDLSLALPELEKTLNKAGLKATREGRALRFDIGPLVADMGLKGLEAVPGKLQGRAQLDINALLKPPILRGEKW